jgi:hypothetical protein
LKEKIKLFLVSQQTPPAGACDTLKIIKNEIKLRKLQPPKVEGVKNLIKQTNEHYKG